MVTSQNSDFLWRYKRKIWERNIWSGTIILYYDLLVGTYMLSYAIKICALFCTYIYTKDKIQVKAMLNLKKKKQTCKHALCKCSKTQDVSSPSTYLSITTMISILGPSKTHVKILIPKVMALRRQGLWEVIRWQEQSPHEWDWFPYKSSPRELGCSSHHVRIQDSSVIQKRTLTWPCWPHDIGLSFQSPELCAINFCCL